MLLTIQVAADYYEIASLRIDALLRQGIITKCVQSSRYTSDRKIVVETTEIDRYFAENPGTLEDWQKRQETTQRG